VIALRFSMVEKSRKKIMIMAPMIMIVCFVGGWFAEALVGDDYYYEVKRGLRLFGDVYKNITEKYVDDITPREFIRSGIDGLLSRLDPYTVFYEGDESSDLDALMLGKYGGIGISVGIKDGCITVISTMDGSPASKAGILPGDRIVTVNGVTTKDIKLQDMSNYVKGEPGTKVKLTIQREGEPHRLDFELVREMIAIENISYAGILEDRIGYIKLTKFSKTANYDLVRALKDLKENGMQSLILDLRGNPGGLLDVAIDITNQFVKKGQAITFTKGRAAESTHYYTATNDPLIPDMPMAVLVDGGSASAAEIVSGALQDLDRAVIVGSTTFGKGLVQTVYPLQERDAVIKITTAKYFTPSGRCIQKEDYSKHAKKNEKVQDDGEGNSDTFGLEDALPDSMKTDTSRRAPKEGYRTSSGRAVYANGGIAPDVEIRNPDYTIYFRELLKRGLLFDYATNFVAHHKTIDSNFSVDERILGEFGSYVQSKKFLYTSIAEQQLSELVNYSKRSNYRKHFTDKVIQLLGDLKEEKSQDFENSKPLMKRALELEIISRYFGNRARIIAGFKYDKAYMEAANLLRDREKYKHILAGK
jgi:carboxyl-terminal processing protease